MALVGCGTTSWVSDPSDLNNVKIEKVIRDEIRRWDEKELTKSDLETVTSLRWFNDLTSVADLEKLTNLNELRLGVYQITSLAELEKLTNLTRLSLTRNKLTSVAGLEKLTKLTWLDLSYNQLTKAQIDELKKALPKCRILSRAKK